jgi:hypothetical protein
MLPVVGGKPSDFAAALAPRWARLPYLSRALSASPATLRNESAPGESPGAYSPQKSCARQGSRAREFRAAATYVQTPIRKLFPSNDFRHFRWSQLFPHARRAVTSLVVV